MKFLHILIRRRPKPPNQSVRLSREELERLLADELRRFEYDFRELAKR